ncbi:MAG: ATPase, T2SS/T4P/T4SS family [Polyangiales bacterium]
MAQSDQRGGAGQARVVNPAVIEEFLSGVGLFKSCDAAVVAKVSAHAEVLEYPRGAVILRAGAPADGMVVLMRGRASHAMVSASTGAVTTLDAVLPGDHSGDVATALRASQPYSLLADEPSVVLRLRAEIVDTLTAKVPQFSLNLARRLASRNVALSMASRRAPSSASDPPAPAAALAQGAVRFVEVSDYEPTASVIQLVPSKLVLSHRLLPLSSRGNAITVGMVSPRDEAAIAELRRVLRSVDLEVVAISQDDFALAVQRFRLEGTPRGEAARGARVDPDSLQFDVVDQERDADKAVRVVGDEVVRAVNRILAGALQREASDVHIEPEAAGVRVRYRVQGMLQDAPDLIPPSFAKGVVARLKILAGLDITDRRSPQDGRIGMTAGYREVDLRVSSLPSSRGEKVVLRVLESAGLSRPLDQLFVEPHTLAAVRGALLRPHGAVLVAGATGSGKSSSLYAMLQERRRARPDSSVLMVEDPIEYRLAGVTQVQVNAGIGLGFAQVLRAALRQDPDVITVGETRDPETARLALESAMTGHLLFTSMHANDAMTTLQRLEGLGCSRSLVAQSVALIVVQRLVRRLCGQCATTEAPAPALHDALAARRLAERGARAPLPRAVGCDHCGGTGYSGRVAVTECLSLNEELRAAMMTGEGLDEVMRGAARAKALHTFAQCASFLMARKVIAATEALLAVAE